ncbi:MAG TPA: UDP-N-acetylmuramate--L-alanine ligase [Gemmatimonadota bacterium]|nr:UDP-N-acetylmuramate--L-alanine ligase [Gemmatimonadota bacterium]
MSAEAAVRRADAGGGARRGERAGESRASRSGGGGGGGAPERLPRRSDLPAAGSEVHLMGAAGAGMRALAVLLAGEGFRVSGCDRSGEGVAEIEDAGGRVDAGHDPSHAEGAALVVRSSAVPEDHPELRAAREQGVPVWRRARALAALVNDRRLAAVSGTHGKTTITAMTALAAEAAGLDPAAAVGGHVPTWDANARSGAGEAAVVEADEYDRSFLELDPDLAVVSAVEEEHLESYGSLEELERAYRTFAGRASDRLGVLYCADEAGARALGAELSGSASYGYAADADYRVEALGAGEDGGVRRARLRAPGAELVFRLGAPGAHNLQNAAAALAAALRLGADPAALEEALAGFTGVARRMERLADARGVLVVDDYAHHPTEVATALAAGRRLRPGARLVAVFQPHLYSRTRRFAEAFARALAAGADRTLLLPVYGAREEPIEGVTSELIVGAAGAADAPVERGPAPAGAGPAGAGGPVVLADRDRVLAAVAAAASSADHTTFLFMGAGDVTALAHRAAAALEEGAA